MLKRVLWELFISGRVSPEPQEQQDSTSGRCKNKAGCLASFSLLAEGKSTAGPLHTPTQLRSTRLLYLLEKLKEMGFKGDSTWSCSRMLFAENSLRAISRSAVFYTGTDSVLQEPFPAVSQSLRIFQQYLGTVNISFSVDYSQLQLLWS